MIISYIKARNKVVFSAGAAAGAAAQAAQAASTAAIQEAAQQAVYASGNATVAAYEIAIEKATSLVTGGAQVGGAGHNAVTFGKTAHKGLLDAARGDKLCTGLCLVACACDAVGICYTLIPILPGKLVVYGGTKCISLACVSFRDSCHASGVRVPGC